MSSFLFAISLNLFSLFALQADSCQSILLHVVKAPQEIDIPKSQAILVKSFMHGYEDVPLKELNPAFESIGDVRRFYEAYFFEEFERFAHGEVFWVEAYVNDTLAGWATFELEQEEENTAYMNLLTVAPKFQGMGVGRHLTFSVLSDELYPNTQAINLLIRKVNQSGYDFYYKIGFFDYDYQRKDNFVDINLLSGLRWVR